MINRPFRKTGHTVGGTAKQIVDSLLHFMRFDPALLAVFETWDKETAGLVKNCQAVAIQGSKIVVRVPSVVHRQELMYMKDRLINRINQAMGRRAISDIQFELENEIEGAPRGKNQI